MRFYGLKIFVGNKNNFFFPNSLVLNFSIFKLSPNSRNKSHANIKCFTVSQAGAGCAVAWSDCSAQLIVPVGVSLKLTQRHPVNIPTVCYIRHVQRDNTSVPARPISEGAAPCPYWLAPCPIYTRPARI